MVGQNLAWFGLLASVGIFYFLENRDAMIAEPWCEPSSDQPPCMFSTSYEGARDRFRIATRHLGHLNLSVHAFSRPLPTDPNLSIDFVLLRHLGVPTTKFVIHSSGVHGVEGFSGSAIQLAALESIRNGSLTIPQDTTVLLVHVVNPFGMSRLRRVNENNVDLNRNGLYHFKDAVMPRDLEVSNFLLLPTLPPGYTIEHLMFWLKSFYLLATRGFTELKRVIVTGQYIYQDGLFYGGTRKQASIKILEDVLDETGAFSNSIVWLDVHTGLGPFGFDTMMVEDDEQAAKAMRMFTKSIIEGKTSGDVDASSGYENMQGDLASYFRAKSTNNHFLYVTQEFGTVVGMQVYRSLYLENSAYHLDKAAQPYTARNYLLPAFNPMSYSWRSSVVTRGIDALRRAISQ